eukprot:m.444426 g.444426  ORF g.444426 m.444426 type:complete len:257 (-) comp56835_c0_seq3:53-823(-)
MDDADVAALYALTEHEQLLLQQLSERAPNTPRYFLVLFLLGRKGHLDQAYETLKAFYQADLKYNILGPLTDATIAQIATGKVMLVQGTSGDPVVSVLRYALDFPAEFSDECVAQLTSILFLCALLEAPYSLREGGIAIQDCRNTKWINVSLHKQRIRAHMTQNCIPGRVRAVYVVDPPVWITTIMAVLTPFLKTKIRERIRLVSTEQLQLEMPRHRIPQELGGDHVASVEELASRLRATHAKLMPVRESWDQAGGL